MPVIESSLLVRQATSIASTMGALYVGGMLVAILYGCTNVQTFIYYKRFPRDQMFQKCIVALLWLLDSLHLIFTIVEFWHYLIDSFGDYGAILEFHWSFSLQILISVIIILAVQSFYTRRIWILSSNRYERVWAWVLILALLAVYAAGLLFVAELYSVSTLPQLSTLRWSIIFGLSMSSFDDFMLAFAVCHFLSIRRTAFKHTKSKIWTIMTYAVISGLLTSICSLTSVITTAVMPHNMIFQAIEFLVPKLYVNSYLAMLNSRKGLRNNDKYNSISHNMIRFAGSGSQHMDNHDIHSRPTSVIEPNSNVPSGASRKKALEVKVDVVRVDDEGNGDHADANQISNNTYKESNFQTYKE